MKKTTDELMNNIKNVLSIEDFFKDNKSEYFNITADQYLRKLLQEKDLKVSQIAVSSCLGYNELQLLLRLAKYLMLDPRDRRDSIFLYAISKQLTVMETNDILFNCGNEILGKISEHK